jgi:hypothetical protein
VLPPVDSGAGLDAGTPAATAATAAPATTRSRGARGTTHSGIRLGHPQATLDAGFARLHALMLAAHVAITGLDAVRLPALALGVAVLRAQRELPLARG